MHAVTKMADLTNFFWRFCGIWRNLSICGHFGESDESNEILPRLLTQLYERIDKGTLKSRRIWRKWRIWWNFAKVVDRIILVNRCALARGAPKSRRIWPGKVSILISGHKWQNGLFYRPCYLFTRLINLSQWTGFLFRSVSTTIITSPAHGLALWAW